MPKGVKIEQKGDTRNGRRESETKKSFTQGEVMGRKCKGGDEEERELPNRPRKNKNPKKENDRLWRGRQWGGFGALWGRKKKADSKIRVLEDANVSNLHLRSQRRVATFVIPEIKIGKREGCSITRVCSGGQ